jgi:hypothetical protein
MDWKYGNKVVKEHPIDAVAFVYYLEFSDGTKYIGKKSLFSTRKKKVIGKTRRVVTVSSSNWRTYMSSSDVVKGKLKAGDRLAKRNILHWCTTLGCATYLELKEQVDRNVLCDPLYLNKWISAKVMRCHITNVE